MYQILSQYLKLIWNSIIACQTSYLLNEYIEAAQMNGANTFQSLELLNLYPIWPAWWIKYHKICITNSRICHKYSLTQDCYPERKCIDRAGITFSNYSCPTREKPVFTTSYSSYASYQRFWSNILCVHFSSGALYTNPVFSFISQWQTK